MFRSTGRGLHKVAVVLAALGLTVAGASTALAEVNPPDGKVLDLHGVDLATGHLNKPITLLTIGSPKTGGLSWIFAGTDDISDNWNGSLDYWGSIPSGASYTYVNQMKVMISGHSVSFYGNCATASACVNANGGPETLTKSGSNWVYTTGDGSTYTFSSDATPDSSSLTQVIGHLLNIHRPDGTVFTINYGSGYVMNSIVSNLGYALKFDWSNGETIYAVNMTAHSCSADATSCDSYDGHASVSGDSYTDAMGNTTVMSMYEVQVDPVNDVDYQYTIYRYQTPTGETVSTTVDQYGRIKTLATPAGTWSYTYSDNTLAAVQSTVNRTVTLKDPSGQTFMTAIVSKTYAFATSSTDALSRKTAYNEGSFAVPNNTNKYFYRLTQIVRPEGDSTSWTYDARGNVTQETLTPKSGSGLSATTEYASYPTTCANAKTCNKPDWTKDAKGNETDYTYDGTHGGVLTVTLPADQNGLRRRTYNTYTAFDTGNGLIYRLTRSETCGLSSSQLSLTACPAASSTSVTTTDYGNASTAPYTYKSFQPYAVTQTDGAGSVSATTTYGYDVIGNVVMVDGPRTDVDDRSYKTYDANRRVIYEIGVLPGGSGSPHRTVIHHVYDAAGRELRTETGYASSDATNGSDFVITSFKRMTYDAAGRLAKTELVQP